MKRKFLSMLITGTISTQLFIPSSQVFAKELVTKSIKKDSQNNSIQNVNKNKINSKKNINLFRIPALEKKVADIVFNHFFVRQDYSTNNEKSQWNNFCKGMNKTERYLTVPDLATNKDIRLHAYYINNNSDTTVILQHGYNSNSMSLRGEAKMFLNQGYNVLLPDEYGAGLSDGGYTAFGAYGKKYINDWIKNEEENHPNQKIILFGQSMGAATVLLSQENANKHVKAIIEDCGYDNLRQELKDAMDSVKQIRDLEEGTKWLIDWNGFKNNVIDELNSNYIEPKLNFNLNNINPINAVKDNSIPKLFIHGTADTLVPVYNEKNLFDATKGFREQLLVNGAEHAQSFRDDKSEYENKVDNFLKFILNTKKTGWQSIDNKKYYFNNNGEMQTGWQSIDNKKYYFNNNGEMQIGWQSIGNKKYYFNNNGEMQIGWQSIGNKKYYFNNNGEMQTGWQNIDNKEYYFNNNGVMQIGWQNINDVWYYFDDSGVLINSKTYELSDWMKGINGNLKLSQLSIPGTHDSMATKRQWLFGERGQDQSLDLDSQLNLGIRYLDIRCRWIDGSFAIHHGPIFEGKMFGDVLNTVKTFLEKHPSETIFMRVKQEYSNASDKVFNETFMKYVKRYPNLFWKNKGNNKQDPTLNSMRGKVVVLYNVAGLNFGLDYAHGIFKIQDNYKDEADTKLNDAINFIKEANTKTNSDAYLNYLSEENGGYSTDKVAAKINFFISRNLEENKDKYKYIGILAADFPTQRLIRHIVDVNFNNNWINIPDAKLKAALNEKLGQKADSLISKGKLESLNGCLHLENKGITNIDGLQYCTNITDLRISGNKISDLSPLKGLTKITGFYLNPQNPVLPEVTSVGHNVTIKNPLVGTDGKAVEPINISNGGKYNAEDNTITFNNINKDETVTFDFDKTEYLGTDHGGFKGTVKVPIKYIYSEEANIPDAKLKAVLNAKLGQKADATISEGQLESLKGTLDLSGKGITNIKGLQYCTNINELNLNSNSITNLEPLKELTNLTSLSIDHGKFNDITPLKNLKNLSFLNISLNGNLSNIKPLSNLTNLKNLIMNGDKISYIEPLKGLTNLTDLNLNSNNINNIESLKGLTNLTSLSINHGKFNDITPLSNLKKLTFLNISLNENLSDIEPLSNLTNLKTIYMNNDRISNIKPLQGLTNLICLYLNSNSITNLEPLKGLTKLTDFNASSQKQFLPCVTSVGHSVTIKNPVVGTDGKSVAPVNISNNGKYNKADNTITFNNINKDETVTFDFDKTEYLGTGQGIFEGTVKVPIK